MCAGIYFYSSSLSVLVVLGKHSERYWELWILDMWEISLLWWIWIPCSRSVCARTCACACSAQLCLFIAPLQLRAELPNVPSHKVYFCIYTFIYFLNPWSICFLGGDFMFFLSFYFLISHFFISVWVAFCVSCLWQYFPAHWFLLHHDCGYYPDQRFSNVFVSGQVVTLHSTKILYYKKVNICS